MPQTMKSRHLTTMLAVVAGYQATVGSAGLANVIGDRPLALLVAIGAGLSTGVAAYVAGTRPQEVVVESRTVVDDPGHHGVSSG